MISQYWFKRFFNCFYSTVILDPALMDPLNSPICPYGFEQNPGGVFFISNTSLKTCLKNVRIRVFFLNHRPPTGMSKHANYNKALTLVASWCYSEGTINSYLHIFYCCKLRKPMSLTESSNDDDDTVYYV